MSPLSEHGVFDEDSDELDGESASTMNLLQQTRWQRLLFEYEYQLLRQAERDDSESSGSSEGMGQLAHDIWRTEERIRTVIARQDPDYGLVPDDLHGKMWMLTSGAQMEMRKRKGLYERLLAMEGDTSTEATVQIDVDLHRTVANGDKELWSAEKTEMMRRVLVAYSFYNTGLGYCQGLNYIVARSLLFLDEEEAFYLLIKMIRLVPDDYYTSMVRIKARLQYSCNRGLIAACWRSSAWISCRPACIRGPCADTTSDRGRPLDQSRRNRDGFVARMHGVVSDPVFESVRERSDHSDLGLHFPVRRRGKC